MREKEERRMNMKLWIDDVRPAPEGYVWCHTVYSTKTVIEVCEDKGYPIELIDIDHDAGSCEQFGGDYIKVLDWLEETGRDYPIRIHTGNAVGAANMRRIIQRNGWREVF
jgi:hypothetical protein